MTETEWTNEDARRMGLVLRTKVEAVLAMMMVEFCESGKFPVQPNAQRVLEAIANYSDEHVCGPQGCFTGIIEAAIEADTRI